MEATNNFGSDPRGSSAGVTFLAILAIVLAILGCLVVLGNLQGDQGEQEAYHHTGQAWEDETAFTYSKTSKLGVHLNTHAARRHPEQAESIRSCLDLGGPYQVWRKGKFGPYFLMCEFQPGEWGVQIVHENGDELTAYQPDGVHSLNDLVSWLRNQATKFTGKLPWIQ